MFQGMSWLAVTDIVSFYTTNVFLNSRNLSHNLSMDHFYRVISGSFEFIFHHSVETICVFVEKLAKNPITKDFATSLCVVVFIVTRQIEFLWLSYSIRRVNCTRFCCS